MYTKPILCSQEANKSRSTIALWLVLSLEWAFEHANRQAEEWLGMMKTGRVDYINFESQALQGNRLDDPAQRDIAVYLPASYDDNPQAHFPTLYHLSSHGRTNHYYIGWNQWEESMIQRFDRLIDSGEMPSVIVVMADFWTRLGGSQFVNSAIGNYASYLVDEIVPLIDNRFRTLPHAKNRAVFGHSSGGYGSLIHAMMNPDVFGAALCQSGDAYWEYTALPALAGLHGQLEKWGGFEKFIHDIPTIRPKGGSFWQAIHSVMYCMAYGVNPENPLGFDSPIDLETGELIPAVWEKWLQYDPVRMVEQAHYQANLKKLRLLMIEVGAYDEYMLQVGARILHRKLQNAAIEHHYAEFPDGHSNTSYRYDVSLPILVKALSD